MQKTQVKIFTIRCHKLYHRSTYDAKEAEKRGMQPRRRGSQEAFFHFSLIYLSICPLIDPIIIYGTPTKHQALSQKYTKFTGDSDGKESACNEGDPGLILGLGRSPGEGTGYQLQYSGLENSMDYIVSPWGCKDSDTTEQACTHTHYMIWKNRESTFNQNQGTSCLQVKAHSLFCFLNIW